MRILLLGIALNLGGFVVGNDLNATEGATVADSDRSFVPPSEELKAASLVYLNNHRSGVDSITSGIVRIRETLTGKTGMTASNLFLAFDATRNCVRYDVHRDAQPLDFSLFCRNETECLYYHPVSMSVGRFPRDWTGGTRYGGPLDIRCVGACSLPAVRMRFAVDRIRSMMEVGVNPCVQSISDAEMGLVSVKWNASRQADSRVLVEIVYNRDQGSMPVRYREVHFDPRDGKISAEQLSQTTWQQKSGVWVPVTWTLEDPFDGNLDTYAFDWESVNEPVPERLFQLAGFDLPKGISILNNRLEKPVQEGVTGQPTKDAVPVSPARQTKQPPLASGSALLGLNGAIAFGIVFAVIYLVARSRRLGSSHNMVELPDSL